MADINVTIQGCDDAVFMWDGENVSLTQAGGTFSTTIAADAKSTHVYGVIVFGTVGGPWSATVKAPTHTNNHSGHMSAAGFDMSGTITFEV